MVTSEKTLPVSVHITMDTLMSRCMARLIQNDIRMMQALDNVLRSSSVRCGAAIAHTEQLLREVSDHVEAQTGARGLYEMVRPTRDGEGSVGVAGGGQPEHGSSVAAEVTGGDNGGVQEALRPARDRLYYHDTSGGGERDRTVGDLIGKLEGVNHRLEHDYNDADVREARREVREVAHCLRKMSIASLFQQVAEFHKVFDVTAPTKPTLIDQETYDLRVKLIREEFQEYRDAVAEGNLKEIADALCDLTYVVIGTAVSHGLVRFDDMFAEVQRSNMSKLGADGKPIKREDGKIIKGPNFTLPNLAQFL